MSVDFIKLSLLAVLVALFSGASLLAAPALSVEALPERYEPVKIASGVAGTPGAVAWSPDGKRIAYIGEKVGIYDASTREHSSVSIDKPRFLAWAKEQALLVLHEGSDGPSLASVDIGSLEVSGVAKLPLGAFAVYPDIEGKRFVVFTSLRKKLKIGVDVKYGLHVLDLTDGSLKEAFSTSRILPLRYSEKGPPGGWLVAGPAPIGGEIVLLEFVSPPAAAKHIQVRVLDPVTGADSNIARIRNGWPNILGGSWDPLGKRAAVADDKGRLMIISLAGEISAVDEEVNGLYPAWDPRGGRIFFGGYLIAEDGSGRVDLTPGKPESSAFFSPDGESVALAADGALWLLKNIEPSPGALKAPASALGEKAALLRELYAEGLITAEEYRERLSAIIDRHGNAK